MKRLWMSGMAALLTAGVWALWPATPIDVSSSASGLGPAGKVVSSAEQVEHGRYLAVLGNCQHCHTARGQVPFSGGRALPTPFGTVFSSNLTPSTQGLGGWTADDFYRALHHGQSRDGRWLYPAFPFNNTTHITRDDSDALFAYLQTLPPSDQAQPVHEVRWPYNTQAAMKVWRTLYFTTGNAQPATLTSSTHASVDAEVQRGAYLVNGLGHCSACHAPRNALGGHTDMLSLHGGLMPVLNWSAPSLHDPAEGGVQHWPLADTVALLQTGRNSQAMVTGPMAEVVQHSTQHWRSADLHAVASYLKALPEAASALRNRQVPSGTETTSVTSASPAGARLYARHCADCHGPEGEGRRTPDGQLAYPALAGNRAIRLGRSANLIHMTMNGGYGPSTAGNPRPFGMPPYLLTLSDADMAAVLTHVRTAWGNQAEPVSELDVQRLRGARTR
jgi:mono/diheme cytochrome c family protein